MKFLITGGAGFIGSNFIRYLLTERADCEILNIDKLTYAGNIDNLTEIQAQFPQRYKFVQGDITDKRFIIGMLEQKCDVIVNFAAESHVDRSIMDSSPFIATNVQGTATLLEAIRLHPETLFVQISTDEVYGSTIENESFSEESPLSPSSPYSASKAAADLLCKAYHRTYELPIVITRCTNNYGPFQFPEKLIPLVITNAIEGKEIPVYGDGKNVRDWIHVKDHCIAIDRVIRQGKIGEIYNIGADNQFSNITIVSKILSIMGKPHSLIKYVSDRPGHDLRYSVDTTKIRSTLGWMPMHSVEADLDETVSWYIENKNWWRAIKSGEYLKHYDKWYSGK